MKNKILSIILAALIASAALLTSCAPSYKSYHTEENIAASSAVGGGKVIAYLFKTDDTNAVMDLCRDDGKRIYRIDLPAESEYYVSLDFEYAFANTVFQDMNFDGELDLYVPCSVTTANLEGIALLWDTEKGKFVLSEELSALYELTVFPEDELITSQDYSNPEGILCSEYKWEDGKLVKVGEYTVNTES